MSDPKQMYSLSFVSSDAKKVEDGYQFTIESAIARVKPTRVMLASVELPLSQQSIEEGWSRVHFTERIHITAGARDFRVLTSYTSAADGPVVQKEAVAQLPLHQNEIESTLMNGATQTLTVRCVEPHGLYAYGECVLPYMESWGDAEILGCSSGAFHLLDAHTDGRLQPVDDYTFSIKIPNGAEEPDDSSSGVVYVPSPTSFGALAAFLSAYVQLSPIRGGVKIGYDVDQNRLVVEAPHYPPDSETLTVTIGGDNLTSRLGLTPGTTRRFTRNSLDAGTLPSGESDPSLSTQQLMLATGNYGPQQSNLPPLHLTSSPLAWPYVRLRRGHYAPTKKSHTPSPPQRIQAEVDVQFNRFLLRRREDGSAPAIVFIDPAGMARIADVMPGRYSADSLAAQLTRVMSDASAATFTVAFSGNAFTVACVNSGLQGSPRTFSILFAHPRSMESARLGFDEITYDGASSYTSSNVVTVPQMQWPYAQPLLQHTNLYQLSEDHSRARMRFVSVAPPPVIGVITTSDDNLLTLDCFASGRPVSHGFAIGAVISLTSPGKSFEINGTQTLPADPGFARGIVYEQPEPNVVVLRVHTSLWLSEVGRVVALSVPVEPLSLCFHPSAENGIAHRLGFDPRVYEHGYDGITHTQIGKLPPYYAPNVYDLDHPDFVLMYLREGKRTSLTHHYAQSVASLPFAKIVLYPVYREERALMRETVLSSGESMNRFTIDLSNPDGTRYELNGSRFSFTLNFIQ